ncbi:GNAT family N-acetyltransferase/peptidase C39 family protein [Pseudoalteromonas sp. MMG022]|uniref:GNAT family N-acetyltransferase/peptidase C39 family protein n=1 Tax=Pseudoalteromonas sp. MMG022 TaxID=2909978 RepID=UPI001F23A9F7|nr:GNAT family N-acetyltransferase/peptidase C39 family protein [Pseudoalteromonas sp. MMG022]MCF6436271.1 GNAT family N-acetyltransferase/peptidase C39 family protein [Pseudoalteromonas sp. MMG022]
MNSNAVTLRFANSDDLAQLAKIEQSCFSNDRLSVRSLRHWVGAKHGLFLVACCDDAVVAYALVWCLKGTRLARLYSLAVLPAYRGQGIAQLLLSELELLTQRRGRAYLRLEVSALNKAAISLYKSLGYQVFGAYSDYYGDGSEALRMQKRVARFDGKGIQLQVPWYKQTTDFTCGPAALMMAMHSLDSEQPLTQVQELAIWREATTIFMTSGHGGCHPIGLALSAINRGFNAQVFLTQLTPLFLEGVRSDDKKQVMSVVHQEFVSQADALGCQLNDKPLELEQLHKLLKCNHRVLMLISTYRLDGKKAPHWVCVTAIDDHCVYVHDPELDSSQQSIDCQHVPIGLEEFNKMATFGKNRLRASIAIAM